MRKTIQTFGAILISALIEDTATVFAIRKNDGYAEIIASYDDGECLSYTRAFKADYQKQSSGGCGANFSAECALVHMAVLIIAVAPKKRVSGFRKENRKKRNPYNKK